VQQVPVVAVTPSVLSTKNAGPNSETTWGKDRSQGKETKQGRQPLKKVKSDRKLKVNSPAALWNMGK